MSKIITPLLPLAMLVHFLSAGASAQQLDRRPNLNVGDAIVTGFSGVVMPAPTQARPANKSATDLTFINADGPSARIVGVGRPGYVWDGRLFQAPKTFDVFARDVGQVFGVALDDQAAPNIYLSATSAFGLNLVGRASDGLPERRKVGGPGTVWMKGQFGLELQGDPGSIYKIDGTTGAVSLFAKVMLDGVPNPGAALGNLAYDATHKQLFVSDLYTGMIHRFAIVDGSEPGTPYDHGTTGRTAANLAPVPFTAGNRPNIANSRFNSENPDTWGFAPAERRVWGLAVQAGRLYYSARNGAATDGPQIWSVGIQRDGSFAADARWELDVPAQPGPYPVSDIAFSQKGAMILAQRAPIAGSYDYSAFTKAGEPRVLRFWLKDSNAPPSPGQWNPVPEEYAIGFAGNYRNTNGGVALGYGYGSDGTLGVTACESSLWSTGQNLRNNPALRSQLEPGGPLLVHGLQGGPADLVRNGNEPPAATYFIDYDDTFDDARASAHVGSVRILSQPCASVLSSASNPSYVSGPQSGGRPGGGGGGYCVGPNCACIAPPTSFPINLSLPPLSLPPCTQVGQPVSLDLSTVTFPAGFDPNWAVTPFGPQAHSTSYWNWPVIGNHWVQPKPSLTNQSHPIGPYVYTRSFNLACRPEAYTSIKLTGQFGSDNDAVMSLNGPANVVASCTNCFNTVPVAFSHVGPAFFVAGLNTLTVTVINRPPGGPTGLTLTGTLEAVCGKDCVCGCPSGTVLQNGQCVPTNPIDLTIGKESTGDGGSGTWFNVWVTNNGAPITFPAGGITVTETVPTGMTVTGVTGTGWSCAPPTMVGPGTMLCTYNLGGSLGTGAQLTNTLVVNYTTTGPGPFTNCATVGASSGVGVDTTPSNDKACATVTPSQVGSLAVTKVVAPDPLGIGNTLSFPVTMTCTNPAASYPLNVHGNTSTVPISLPVGSNCSIAETLPPPPPGCAWLAPVYSPSTVIIAAGVNVLTAINAYECKIPRAPVSVSAACDPRTTTRRSDICACRFDNMVRVSPEACGCTAGVSFVEGRGCITSLVCRPPLIPDAAGKVCICGPGLVQRGQSCGLPTVCNLPARLNSRGNCECPTDMVATRNGCAPRERREPSITPGGRERREPSITPGDILRNIPDGVFGPGGGGRDNPGGPRGGEGPTGFPGR